MKDLIELYISLLASVGMVTDEDGFISTRLPGSDTSKPFMIENRRLVLPTKIQLNEPDWSNRIGFHPLLQKVEEGESKSVEKFRDRMNAYSDFMAGAFFLNLAELATKEEKHMNLTPAQSAYLGPFSDADAKFVKFIATMVTTSRLDKKNFEFVRFSLLRGRVVAGKKRSRVAVLHFPLYDALPPDGSGTTILGHKLRGKDVKMLRSLYEFLFPGIGVKEDWEIPSDSLIAASMECLMAIYAKFVNGHNTAVSVLGNALEAGEDLLIVNDWQTEMGAIEQLRSQIQSIPWLEGAKTQPPKSAASQPLSISGNPLQAPQVHAKSPILKEAPVVQQHQPTLPETYVLNQPAPAATGIQPRFIMGVVPSAKTQPGPVITQEQVVLHTTQQAMHTGVHQAGAVYVDPRVEQERQIQQQQYQLQQQQLQLQQQQLAQQQAQAARVPDSARLINNQLYIPVESSGVSQVPVGGLMVDGKLYMPMQQHQQQMQQMAQFPVVGAVNQFGMAPNQLPQPSQVPNLSPQEVAYYTANPVAWQNYLSQLQVGAQNQIQAQNATRVNTVPRYLREAVQRETAAAQQAQYGSAGFFNYNR